MRAIPSEIFMLGPMNFASMRLGAALSLFLFFPTFSVGILSAKPEAEAPDLTPLKQWIAKQKDVRTVTADFTQTRALRTLRSPLASEGRLWFRAPDWFRWELGDPPKTIVIGTPQGMTVIHPEKKQAERKPMAVPGKFEGAGTLGMMRIPGGGSFEEFQKSVRVLALESSGSRCHLEMLPRDAARALDAIKLDFDPVTGHWFSLEIVTREGSSIRNEFRQVRVNGKVDKEVFEYDLTGFHVTDEKN